MTVLVTGGAGYIGSHTVRALRAAGQPVVVLDSMEFGRPDAVIDAPLVVGDIHDAALVEQVCADHGVTSLVHFAAYKSVGESMENPTRYWHNNVDGTVTLVDAAVRQGVEEIVFSSSCSVYGTPAEVPVVESAPIAPESVYAESKATVERILHWYGVTQGVRSVSLRYFNAAGASFDGRIGEDWTFSINLIPLVMKALLLDQPVRVFGTDYPTPDGTAIRDYIHVDDLAAAHVAALGYLADGGATTAVNLGTGVGSSVFEVLAAAEAVAGRPAPHEIAPRRAGDPVATFADPSHAQKLLDWRAEYGLDEVVDTAYRWHCSQAG
jgi:UDP-glucose-4-epimerase GalE